MKDLFLKIGMMHLFLINYRKKEFMNLNWNHFYSRLKSQSLEILEVLVYHVKTLELLDQSWWNFFLTL